jgi:hypothetical protein
MRLPSYLIWPCVFIGQFLATSLLAWHLLAQISFAYPLGYKMLGLEQHIAEFAPINRHKQGFAKTKPEDHWELFAQITQAVQHGGEGLAKISYPLPNGTREPLMHQAEIIHLQDVSNLINKFYAVGIAGGILWIVAFAIAMHQRASFPSLRRILLGFCGGIFAITTLVLTVGATKVFYWFHTKIFPDGHQWFFYYEDSLMTTLMKAPDIFAFIAVLLLTVLITFWALGTWGMLRLLKRNTAIAAPEKQSPTQQKSKQRRNKKASQK